MGPLSTMLLLPTALLAFLLEAAANQPAPTAIRKQTPNANAKLFPEHLGFAPLRRLTPLEAAAAAHLWLGQDSDFPCSNGTPQRRRPAFALHHDEPEESVLRRAAAALAILQKRTSCPAGMSSCDSIGAPNKCCQDGTYCTDVPDTTVGQVACCLNGATCGGGIGSCPAGAISCAADLGGGCCIPGYVCQGIGCVPSASATPSSIAVASTAPGQIAQTITSTQTTLIEGSPSTVVVTLTVAQTSSRPPTTQTAMVTATGSATGVPPWRPTAITPGPDGTVTGSSSGDDGSGDTQTGCPTGFYGCLATHGGGCCQTNRDCNTVSCPATPTTILSDGVTVVVPASDVPVSAGASTCAGGWFLCGTDAGPVAGCCPSGYRCGTASCFTAEATETGQVQKQVPSAPSRSVAAGGGRGPGWVLGGVVGSCLFLSLLA